MSVVLRCPTCGTTQGHVGECEACSEREVRYFCTNHEEGIWLDSPVCSRCGAKFGDPPRPSRTPRAAAVPPRPAGAPDFRPPLRSRAPVRPAEADFGGRPPRRPDLEEPADGEILPRTPSLGEWLEEVSEERARARGGYRAGEMPRAEPTARPGFPVAGCLGRVVGLVFLLIVAALVFLFLLFGAFFN